MNRSIITGAPYNIMKTMAKIRLTGNNDN